MRITRSVLFALAATCLTGLAQAAPFSYITNFSAGVGAEWTIATSYNNHDAGILGQLADGSATLSLTATGPGTSNLSFDLLGFRTVDGVNCCTDTFNLRINGVLVFQGAYAMGGGGTDAVWVNTLGATVVSPYGYNTSPKQFSIPSFALNAGTNTIKFDYGAMQGFGDEAWGLDNVALAGSVTPIPEPETYALMLAGLAAVGFVARRRNG
jgi:hypothetical protein